MPVKGVFTSKVWSVVCPSCKAGVGRPCVRLENEGKYVKAGTTLPAPHYTRKTLYESCCSRSQT